VDQEAQKIKIRMQSRIRIPTMFQTLHTKRYVRVIRVNLLSSVADPDPESDTFMNNGSGIRRSLESVFWLKIIQFLDADPDPGSGIF
jgi:hypothetical protein